jgi:hypothetical protein
MSRNCQIPAFPARNWIARRKNAGQDGDLDNLSGPRLAAMLIRLGLRWGIDAAREVVNLGGTGEPTGKIATIPCPAYARRRVAAERAGPVS